MDSWKWQIENPEYLKNAIKRCKEKGILLPTFKQLKDPASIPQKVQEKLSTIGVNEVHPLNLFRINWRNDITTGKTGSNQLC